MARFVTKCPKCEHEESVISTSLNADMPPCPRCEDFVRMVNITPTGDQTQVISTAGSNATADADAQQPTTPLPVPPPQPKKRDMRDWGPEPRT